MVNLNRDAWRYDLERAAVDTLTREAVCSLGGDGAAHHDPREPDCEIPAGEFEARNSPWFNFGRLLDWLLL